MLAPIALFVYNRPQHLAQTISSLKKNKLASESDLYIFSDGAKKTEHKDTVDEVRNYIKTINGFNRIEIIERVYNIGLANSIIDGVSRCCKLAGKVIVLEDDMVLSPYFLEYMNSGLDVYQHEAHVASIHGYVYPTKTSLPETFFLRGADCWGWATWQRAWHTFEQDGAVLLQRLQQHKLCREFDLDNSAPNIQMLRDTIAGRVNSWAIRWHASCFLNNYFTLYPGRSLVHNIGLDSTGEHCAATDIFSQLLSPSPIVVSKLMCMENRQARESIKQYFLSIKPKLTQRIIRNLCQIFQD